MSNRLIVFGGWPGRVGGAGTESFETQKFFRRHGLEVHCFPTWDEPESGRRAELEALGVVVHLLKPHEIQGFLRDLGGPPIVTFINEKVLPHAHRWRGTSPWIHIPCMTYVHSWERISYQKAGPPEALVFQSDFQRDAYQSGLARHRYPTNIGHSIRGAFCWDEWTFDPQARRPASPFRVCRIARPDPAKWSSQLFKALDPVPNIRATFLGADEAAVRNFGRRGYARVWKPGSRPVAEVLAESHAMVCMNNSAKENWPRTGLEAMAAGVPLVVDNKWGWVEMVQHGRTGFLCGHAREFSDALQDLEADDDLRLEIACEARRSLELDLANPAVIWAGWQRLFRAIGASHLAEEPKPTPDLQRVFYPHGHDPVQRPTTGNLPDAPDTRDEHLPVSSTGEQPAAHDGELPRGPAPVSPGFEHILPDGPRDLAAPPQATGRETAEEVPTAEETPPSPLPLNPGGREDDQVRPGDHEVLIELRPDLGPDRVGIALEDSRPIEPPVGIKTEPVTPADLGLPDQLFGSPVKIVKDAAQTPEGLVIGRPGKIQPPQPQEPTRETQPDRPDAGKHPAGDGVHRPTARTGPGRRRRPGGSHNPSGPSGAVT